MENDILLGLIEKLTQSLTQKPNAVNGNDGQPSGSTPQKPSAKNKIVEVLRKHDEISKRIDEKLKNK